MAGPVGRVATAAQDVKPLRLILSALAFPFYVVGLAVGVIVVVFAWVVAAIQVGYSDVRRVDDDVEVS